MRSRALGTGFTCCMQVGGLDMPTKLAYWGSLNPPLPYDPVSNIKSFRWDQTCIHSIGSGPSPAQFSTVFPHALSLGSTWDTNVIQVGRGGGGEEEGKEGE